MTKKSIVCKTHNLGMITAPPAFLISSFMLKFEESALNSHKQGFGERDIVRVHRPKMPCFGGIWRMFSPWAKYLKNAIGISCWQNVVFLSRTSLYADQSTYVLAGADTPLFLLVVRCYLLWWENTNTCMHTHWQRPQLYFSLQRHNGLGYGPIWLSFFRI